MKHTPEPWRVEFGYADWGMPVSHLIMADAFTGVSRIDYLAEVLSIQPYCLGASQKDLKFAATQRANARRIVACVNACEGIPTEDLEDKNSIHTQALGRFISKPARQQIATLEQQRDVLVEVLKRCLNFVEHHSHSYHGSGEHPNDIVTDARAAIQSIEESMK